LLLPLLPFGFLVRSMTAISSGRSELTQFMTYHIFSYKNWNMLATIMDCDSQPYELREDSRTARPSFDWTSIVFLYRSLYLFQQMKVDERTFF